MKRKKHITLIVYCISMCLLLAGCGRPTLEIPELIEPVSVNESYRPVYYGNVGKVTVENGIVVPTDYCHFWTGNIVVSEIKVEIGDYVQAGDIIAVADKESAEEEILAINEQISLQTRVSEISDARYELDKKELEYELKGSIESGNSAKEMVVTTKLEVLEENHKYDILLHRFNTDKLGERLEEVSKIATDGNLVANHSGYVTYIKDIYENNVASNCENVVIISDYDNRYIELKDVPVMKNYMDYYPVRFTEIDGKKYHLEEYEYAKDELIVAQSQALYPPLRLKLSGNETMPEVGTLVPCFFMETDKENVLVVGMDSLYQDATGDYVYVKSDTGKQIRYVTLGANDGNYAEVLSGLEEGELVYYYSEAVQPTKQIEYSVKSSDYQTVFQNASYKISRSKGIYVFSEYTGLVESSAVSSEDTVSKGDLIFSISTEDGKAKLTEMKNNIDNFKSNHNTALQQIDNAISDLEKEMERVYNESTSPVENIATASDAEYEDTELYLYERMGCQLEKLKLDRQMEEINYSYQIKVLEDEYDEASKNNDGTGVVNVYAEYPGKISHLGLRPGMKIESGEYIYKIFIPTQETIEISPATTLGINQTVNFVDDNGKTYTGKVIGANQSVYDGKIYLTRYKNKIFITKNYDTISGVVYYIKVDDKSFYSDESNFKVSWPMENVSNTFVIPNGMVHSEAKGAGGATQYYVWKKDGENIYKHYVQYYGGIDSTGDAMPENLQDDCVISGLKEGDIIISEIEMDVEE